jgi:uncharacterized protein YbjT (DUF2867 family)
VKPKTALVAGPTGLIGRQLTGLLLADDRYQKVIVLTRRSLGIDNPKLSEVVLDLDRISEQREALRADDVFICLGTTIAKAKTKENFYKVDFYYPSILAKIMHENGASQFLIVSALGADIDSSVYYNRVKGEVEAAVAKEPYQTIHILRPSLLLGPREEKRTGEDAAKVFFQWFGWLFIGPLRKYRAIESAKVARAMLALAKEEKQGVFVHESEALQNY